MGSIANITRAFRRLFAWAKRLSRNQKIILLAAVVVLFVVVVSSLPKGAVEETAKPDTRAVALINVGEASTETTPLEVTGGVRSESEARLRTETQGEVVGVYATVGQYVGAGTVIAELRNTSERAAVEQAQAALEAAKANLAKGTGGARSEELAVLEISRTNAQDSLDSATVAAENTLLSAYSTVDDVISGSADALFSNPESVNPTFNLATSESEIVTRLRQNRIAIQSILKRESTLSKNIKGIDDVFTEIKNTEDEVRFIQDFLNDLFTVVNNAIPTPSVSETAIAGYKTSVGAARTSISGTLTSLTNARTSLNNSKAALEIAEKNLEIGKTGAQSEDVTALTAAVKQAEAGLSVARANLSRTLIVTPISGTLNTLNLRTGDFANVFELAAIVANNNALEIETYVTDEDKDEIRVGSKAVIAGRYQGVVTSIASGLDPATKKIEVHVGVTDAGAKLTNGSSVRVQIERNDFRVPTEELERITIPISALKVETDRVLVFTVDEENKLVAHEVITGLVLGNSVVIEDGLSPDMNIVKDARGLREGESVNVQ